jgi:hypothetical protein
MLIGLFSPSLYASIVFLGGGLEGGLSLEGAPGLSFGYQSADTTGNECVEIESLGMYNCLHWNFSESAVTIISEMSGGPDNNNFAWVSASWVFQVNDAPVDFRIDASVDLINARFMRAVDGGHECISPGCDFDWLRAGTTVGTLLPGNMYVMEFQPSVTGNSSFLLQVPEPSVFLLMVTGLAGLRITSLRKTQA